MKYKSCKHLEKSLYLAPNELRACCQRFFYKGKMRGDAKLLEISKEEELTSENLKDARKKLFDDIQLSQNEDCLGCPHLYDADDEPKIDNKIDYLSVEHHSVCNLRCTYCSPIYYEGKKSTYDVVKFIDDLKKNNSFENCEQVVWGGGEPTLEKSFEQIVKLIDYKVNPKIYHRVFTNSVRFSPPLNNFLKEGLVKIVTSVDAGDPETFKKIRGRPRFKEVFENLSKYALHNPSLVTIKYIFTDENNNKDQVDSFIENCVKNNLENCNYQISMNFKDEKLGVEKLKIILYLFGKLLSKNIKKIFVDDHIMFRFQTIENTSLAEIKNFLKMERIEKTVIDKSKLNDVIIYGAGKIGNEIIKKTILNDNNLNFDIVDSSKEKIDKIIHGKKINPPEFLINSHRKVFISAAQSYDEIYQNIIKLQGHEKNILSGMIL